MPVLPENLALYLPDWPEISYRIRFERAGARAAAGDVPMAICSTPRQPHPPDRGHP